MTNSIDQAFEPLLKIRAEIKAAIAAGPNEADTRLKVLDRYDRQWRSGRFFHVTLEAQIDVAGHCA